MFVSFLKRSEIPSRTWIQEGHSTVIPYRLQSGGHVTLRIYDPSGEEIQELVNKRQKAGEHMTSWNGKTWQGKFAPSGVYYYRVISNNSAFTGRIVHSNGHC